MAPRTPRLTGLVAVQIYDGIPVERAAQHFRDTNGLGVGINAALLLGHDYDDPWTNTTRKVFAELGVPLEEQSRQVKSKDLVLRAVPVSAALGALGRPFYPGDLNGQLSAKAALNSNIDWTAGPHWSGIAGKVNPSRPFSVGSGKENGYATYRALTESDNHGYKAIRHLEPAA